MIHSTLSTRDTEECSPHASLAAISVRSSHRSRSFKTVLAMVSAGGSSQVITRSRRLAPSGTSMSWKVDSPSLCSSGNRTAADPAVGPVPVQDAGARRRLAQPVLRLQRPRPAGGWSRGRPRERPARVRPDRTRHQSRTRQRRMFPVLRAASSSRAATPAVVGEAMLVPLIARYSPRLPPPRVEWTRTPVATT